MKKSKNVIKKDRREFPTDLFVQMPSEDEDYLLATAKKDGLNPEDGVNVGIYALTGILRVKKTVTLE
jgi:hypothetical protein